MAELVTIGDMIINADQITWVEKHEGGVTIYFDYAFSAYKTVHEADRQANKTAVLFEGRGGDGRTDDRHRRNA